MDIRNMPAEAAYYEFVVAIPNADHYTFIGMYADGYKAENVALEYGGIVIHNVRIQGYQPPEPKKKYYTFSGTWSWGCWATSEKEARKQFDEAYAEDIDIEYDHIEIEVDE
jgi:hypothetical protein